MTPPNAAPPPVEDNRIGTADFWQLPAEERDVVFAELRRERPLSRHPAPEDMLGIGERDDRPFWALVRHEDIRRVSRDPQTFCSGQGVMFGDAPPEMLEASLSFLAMDAPRHTSLRKLVSAAFSPRQVARIEEGIRANARVVVEEAAQAGGGGDFVELIAKRLPLMTISEMVGVPEADRERVVEAADVLVTALDEDSWSDVPPLQKLGEALWTLTETSTALAAERAARPRDDLMTALVQAEVDGERLTHAEIAAFFVLLAVAGNDTTRHTTSHAMRALTTNPDQRALLLDDLDGRLPTAVEEFVRWATPVLTFRRTTTRPVELHGVEIPAGEKVLLFYHSGNRDERAFERPWTFDVTRDPNHHLGFGGGGPHYCLGSSLARTQLRALFGELLRTLPTLEVGEPALFRTPGFIHAVKRMECVW
ncbi:cytochrome P450 [Conexibacter stalactiti]|uniref:Cytochrome P450 n=1 Tax=Conexibacter stalactiti TaxID=1940611 RepID=A0ABU4HQV5_9ACTN|nr:cytochrome P450 [Conexibacter stalactiti]MDW5595678.1 cytochrome P450 [Conexibacter stalactiti]MEC5036320.1 cytochrome P450 [Conexibacter stalactiti]